MDFYAQLEQMRANYAANPKKNVFLMRPSWMGFGDELGVSDRGAGHGPQPPVSLYL